MALQFAASRDSDPAILKAMKDVRRVVRDLKSALLALAKD